MIDKSDLRTGLDVRVIVEDESGRILVLRRCNTSRGCGQWCLPGGKVDAHETVEHAAGKELEEEAGLHPEHLEFLFFEDAPGEGPGGLHHVTFYYHAKTRSEARIDPAESDSHRWLSREEAKTFPLVFGNEEALRRWLGK